MTSQRDGELVAAYEQGIVAGRRAAGERTGPELAREVTGRDVARRWVLLGADTRERFASADSPLASALGRLVAAYGEDN